MKETERRVVAGRYELEKLLGQGGMGEVWVATDLNAGGKIALKLLKVEASQSKEHRARFEREARLAKTLVSPHITRVTDSGVDDEGRPYMALELLEGEDLQKRIKTEKVLPLQFVVWLAIQVGRALHVAHSAGLVHRDLKPANIFLARQGGGEEIAKVLDFGIAKGQAESSEFTTAGEMLGTASYMSPEQIRNAKTVDHRADLWALAVVLFRSLTGQFPFEEQGFELFLALMQDPIPSPVRITTLVPTLPMPLNVFFERSFLRDMSQRYATASAMIVGFCRAAGVTVPPDVLHAASAPMPEIAPFSMSGANPIASSASGAHPMSVSTSGAASERVSGPPLSPPAHPMSISASGAPASGPPVSSGPVATPPPISGSPMGIRPVPTPPPISGTPVSSGPVANSPVTPRPAANLSGTLMLDVAPEPMSAAARSGPLPAAGRPMEAPSHEPELDPNEPDNAATLFYQPGMSAPVQVPEARPPSSSYPSLPSRPQVFTFPLEAARAAAASDPQNAAPPGAGPAAPLAQSPWQAIEAAPDRRPRGGSAARRANLFILIVIGLLVVIGGGAALFFLRG